MFKTIIRQKYLLDEKGETAAHILVSKSVKHPDAPEKSKIIRANIKLRGILISPSPEHNGTKITIINNQDVNG